MKTAELKATIREKVGAKNAKRLRGEDKIPAVLYGESGVKHIEVDYLSAAKIVNSPEIYLINLDAGGENRRVIVQDTQYHPLTEKITHIDFLEAAVGKTATLRIPVTITGNSVGLLAGGQLVVKLRHLHVKGIPAELPEHIDVDITNLNIGKSIKVRDLKGYNIIDPANAVVVLVKAARNLEELLAPAEGVATTEGAAEGEGEGEEKEGEEGEAKEGGDSEKKSE